MLAAVVTEIPPRLEPVTPDPFIAALSLGRPADRPSPVDPTASGRHRRVTPRAGDRG